MVGRARRNRQRFCDFSHNDAIEKSVELSFCRMTREGQESFIEGLQKYRSPTCSLASAAWKSRLHKLSLETLDDRCLSEVFNVLSENKGLEYLSLPHLCAFNDDSMDTLCQAFQTHPTLETLAFPLFNSSGVGLSPVPR